MIGYTTLDEVKELIREKTLAHDTEITTSIEDAGYFTDSLMQLYTTVPLTSVPNEIKRANKYLAAALYYYHNPTTDHGVKQAEMWWKFGEIMLNAYILHRYYKGEMS